LICTHGHIVVDCFNPILPAQISLIYYYYSMIKGHQKTLRACLPGPRFLDGAAEKTTVAVKLCGVLLNSSTLKREEDTIMDSCMHACG
jgi:hypothetical protein